MLDIDDANELIDKVSQVVIRDLQNTELDVLIWFTIYNFKK